MPFTKVRGVNINYKILGDNGPWVALSPGGRRDLGGVELLATRIAAAGHRVVIHDRRNCGISDIVIEGEDSEYEIWADDLQHLLSQLGALPAVIGGSSSGCRTSLLFALRHPGATRALLLWRVTGGRFAAERLAEQYYGQYIKAAKEGGMAAVCEMEHFRERIAERPENGARLLSIDPARFIAVMAHWRDYFVRGADLPVIGATEQELKSIAIPACIVPGNDKTHSRQIGETAHRLLSNAELHHLMQTHHDLDLAPREEWDEKLDELAEIFIDFLKRNASRPV